MSITNVEVRRGNTENSASLLRRFSRKIQETGMVSKLKGERYEERKPSKLSLKQGALKRIQKRKMMEKLRKLGKSPTK